MRNIYTTLNVHFEWVVLKIDIINVYNIISYGVIFLKLCAIGG
jgi:hypothetical protein